MRPADTSLIEREEVAPIIGLHVTLEGRLIRFDELGFTPGCGRELVIGRDESCDIRAPDTAAVSRTHAALRWNGAQLMVRDLGSTNGTKLNGRVIAVEATMEPSFYLLLGKFELVAVGPDLRIPLIAHSVSSLVVQADRVFPSRREAADRIGLARETFRRKLQKKLHSLREACRGALTR